jgi:hypothetical protein
MQFVASSLHLRCTHRPAPFVGASDACVQQAVRCYSGCLPHFARRPTRSCRSASSTPVMSSIHDVVGILISWSSLPRRHLGPGGSSRAVVTVEAVEARARARADESGPGGGLRWAPPLLGDWQGAGRSQSSTAAGLPGASEAVRGRVRRGAGAGSCARAGAASP